MSEKSLIKPYDNIIDPHPTGGKAAEVVETILPYFPEHPSMRRYLAYISCGYTRKEAIRRCRAMAERDGEGQDAIDIDEWRNDPQFRELDDAGYNILREKIAAIYMELMVRRDTIQILELNEAVITSIQRKIDQGVELTKDERFIFNKAAAIYTPDKIAAMTKLIQGSIFEDGSLPKGQVFDMVAIIKGTVRT